MKITTKIALAVMMFLAAASGIAKILLIPQEVAFFGAFGFNKYLLMGFGLLQVLGAILLLVAKSRMFGITLVGVTFVVSALVLLTAGKIATALVTLFFVGLLVFLWSRFRLRS
jgi:hypothetical protein